LTGQRRPVGVPGRSAGRAPGRAQWRRDQYLRSRSGSYL